MIKYFKIYKGFYKIEGNIVYSFQINPFTYTTYEDVQEYSNSDIIVEYINKAHGQEITEKEFNILYNKYTHLKELEKEFKNNVKEFLNEYL